MTKTPRFLFIPDVVSRENRQYVLCTRNPACIAEIFEYHSKEDVEQLKNDPPKDWFIDLFDNKTVIAGQSKYPLNGVYYVLVIRKFFETPTERDIPIKGNIQGGVISRMIDWFYAFKKEITE